MRRLDARGRGAFFMATKRLYHRLGQSDETLHRRARADAWLMLDECLLAWRIVNIVSPKFVGCSSSLLQLRHNRVVGLASARR